MSHWRAIRRLRPLTRWERAALRGFSVLLGILAAALVAPLVLGVVGMAMGIF